MGMLNNGLILMGLAVSDQMIVRGLIILVAVAISLHELKRSEMARCFSMFSDGGTRNSSKPP